MAEVIVEKNRCKGCRLCISFCPKGVLKLSRDLNKRGFHFAEYKGNGCIGCLSCAIICPDTCIEIFK